MPTGSGTACRPSPTRSCLQRLAASQTTLEVCPTSNVALGVAATAHDVPLLPLLEAGVQVALGADDPLLFGPRLAAQYELARQVYGLADADLARLARMSVLGSAAPIIVQKELAGRHRLLARCTARLTQLRWRRRAAAANASRS